MAYSVRDPRCPFVVAWKGHGIGEMKTAWHKARVRAGVPALPVHDLRRTAARNMIRAGVPERQVLDIVGWKTRAMLDRYNIVDERDVHTAGDKMAHYFEEKTKVAATRNKQGEVRTIVRTAKEGNERGNSTKSLSIQ
jgi:integrase